MTTPNRELILVEGKVQGVGMRPFLFRQATEQGLQGDVRNTASGLEIRLQGERPDIDLFLERLETRPPRHAEISSIRRTAVDAAWRCPSSFRIVDSQPGRTQTVLPADRATCGDCLRELFEPTDRRYRHPFISCTQCGPRQSITLALPWDRCRTTMAPFHACSACSAEVQDVHDRRFHSQTNSCHECGPRLQLTEFSAQGTSAGDTALERGIELLRRGAILAVKGMGGFHLMTRTDCRASLEKLRELKQRERKPMAVMFPQLENLAQCCELSAGESRLLTSPMAPIVLLRQLKSSPHLDPLVAPGLDVLGAMLPATPLQHLLLDAIAVPLVVTSANRRGEPLCYREDELSAMAGYIEGFVADDREIHQPLDDSIVQFVAGRPMALRRARGYGLEFGRAGDTDRTSLAAGADLKNTVAANACGRLLIAPHVGGLNSVTAEERHQLRIRQLCELYHLAPDQVICDMHPDYHSSRLAEKSSQACHRVQHHRAHLYAVLAENPEVQYPALGVVWDGTGYGADGTIWGGEFFRLDQAGDRRLAHLRTLRLPGAERAIREPRRLAFSLLYELLGDAAVEHPLLPSVATEDAALWGDLLRKQINSPLCSSAGRLFDAVAALLGAHPVSDYEGEAATCLEQLAMRYADISQLEPWPADVLEAAPVWEVDWRPMLRQFMAGLSQPGAARPRLAAQFHVSMAHAILTVTQMSGCRDILVGGGCFQNRILLEQVQRLAGSSDRRLFWPRELPPGDGGIAAGQLFAMLSGAIDD